MFESDTVNNSKYKVDIIKGDKYIGRTIANGYEWDGWMHQDLKEFYRTGTKILDVGANIGYNTLMCSEYGPVESFEPLFHDFVSRNVSRNNLKHEVRVNRFGLSDVNETVKMYLPFPQEGEINYGGSSMNPHDGHNIDSVYEVETKVLDEIFDEPVSIVKLDVEGHEERVLNGMKNLLEKYKPYTLIEIHDIENSKIPSFMYSLGYTGGLIRPEKMYGFF